MRLGDLDALKQELVSEMVKCMRMSEESKGSMAERVLNRVDEAPTIEAKPVKRGRWKFHKDGSGTCDQCRFTQKHIYDDDGWQNYCGVCGADMRERRDNNAK